MNEKKNYLILIGQGLINLGVICQMAGAKRMGTPHPELAVSAVQANLFGMRVERILETPEGFAAVTTTMEAKDNVDAQDDMIEEAADEAGNIAAEIRRRLARAEKLH